MSSKLWDERYSEPGFAYGTEANVFLMAQVGQLPRRAQVLALGDGEGRNSVYLAGQGMQVTAVDQSAVGMDKAAKLGVERGVEISTVVADLVDYDMGVKKWDAIVSIWCHLPSALRKQVHRRAMRALKPGGWLILEAYGPGQLALGTGGPKDADMLATAEVLMAELDELDWPLAVTERHEVQEGKFHRGLSEVVQLVGRKPLNLFVDLDCACA